MPLQTIIGYHFIALRIAKTQMLTLTSPSKDEQLLDLSYTAREMKNYTNTLENILAASYKVNTHLSYDPEVAPLSI